ncbi:MAG TPA: prepilin-type N-terminal cleavage/methylation domain-containing protein [Terrimicrobiaceae bacterium]|nr:prepilin-type N-terminal cleavage/methylation domain-containing protein [Terrimicrobiaceae bacterium]
MNGPYQRRWRNRPDAAFTLLETLVVVGILLILIVLGTGPGLRMFTKNAAAAKCVSNLRQIGAAFQMYASDNNGQFPAIAGDSTAPTKDEQDGKGAQWDQELAPFLGIKESSTKSPMKNTVYYCPASEADPGYAGKAVVLLSYTYNVNIGRSESGPGIRSGNAANPSTVMLLADLQLGSSTPLHSYVPQTGQGRNNTIVFRPSTAYYKFLADRHRGRMNMLFLDGHVDSRKRLVENELTSPPEDVRWTPDGALTGTN